MLALGQQYSEFLYAQHKFGLPADELHDLLQGGEWTAPRRFVICGNAPQEQSNLLASLYESEALLKEFERTQTRWWKYGSAEWSQRHLHFNNCQLNHAKLETLQQIEALELPDCGGEFSLVDAAQWAGRCDVVVVVFNCQNVLDAELWQQLEAMQQHLRHKLLCVLADSQGVGSEELGNLSQLVGNKLYDLIGMACSCVVVSGSHWSNLHGLEQFHQEFARIMQQRPEDERRLRAYNEVLRQANTRAYERRNKLSINVNNYAQSIHYLNERLENIAREQGKFQSGQIGRMHQALEEQVARLPQLLSSKLGRGMFPDIFLRLKYLPLQVESAFFRTTSNSLHGYLQHSQQQFARQCQSEWHSVQLKLRGDLEFDMGDFDDARLQQDFARHELLLDMSLQQIARMSEFKGFLYYEFGQLRPQLISWWEGILGLWTLGGLLGFIGFFSAGLACVLLGVGLWILGLLWFARAKAKLVELMQVRSDGHKQARQRCLRQLGDMLTPNFLVILSAYFAKLGNEHEELKNKYKPLADELSQLNSRQIILEREL